MLAYTYPLADLFWTMLEIFLFFIWIWILFMIFGDIFRSEDMGGWAKALWVIFVIILPFVGILVYLIARGGKMTKGHLRRPSVNNRPSMPRFARLPVLRAVRMSLRSWRTSRRRARSTDAEFQTQKAKLLG